MKIAYLINHYPKVSHTFIRREILALEAQGIAVTRLALRGWADDAPDAVDQQEKQRTQYLLKNGVSGLLAATLQALFRDPRRFARALRTALGMGRRAERPWPFHLVYLAEACAALRLLAPTGVAHVHAHFGTNAAEVALLLHTLGGPEYSFTVHGSEEFDKPEFLHLAGKIRGARFVVAISSFCRSQLYRWVEATQWHKVQVVHCGLEKQFHAASAGLALPPAAGSRLVCVGRLCEPKGHLLLVEAASRLASRGVDFELVLAGDGELRPLIEARVAALGLARRVRITGWISSKQVRDEILGARAMVVASFAEGLPVVLMEAMALRRPVVSTMVAGIPELLHDGETGWLVPAGDVEALANAMQACLACDDSALQAMGERAQRRVLERHDIDTEASKLVDLFRSTQRPGDVMAGQIRVDA